MDCTLLYLRRNATITRQRRLKFTRAKTWRTSTPWKIAKLAAKYKRCEISANVRHCTRLELFKRCKFLEFRKSRSKISRHSPLNGKMILRRVFDRGILEQGVCGIDPRAKFPRREQDGRKWNDDIDGRDGFLLPADASRDQEAEEYARFSVQTPRWPKLTDWQTTSRHEPNQQQATPPPLSTREAWEALSYFAFFFFFFSFFSSPQLASTLASRRPTAGPRLFDSSARYAPNLRSEFSREARKIAVTPVLAFVCLFFSDAEGKCWKDWARSSKRLFGELWKEKMFQRGDGRCWQVRELAKFFCDTGAKSSVEIFWATEDAAFCHSFCKLVDWWTGQAGEIFSAGKGKTV